MRNQWTLEEPTKLTGRGVHTGLPCELAILPAAAGTGFTFRRVDLSGSPEVQASIKNVAPEDMLRRTTLTSNGVSVTTVEHVLSALRGLNVDNAIIEMSSPEPPFLDGSSLPFAKAVQEAGLKCLETEQTPIVIEEPLFLECEGAALTAIPSEDYRVTYFFESENPLLRRQSTSFVITQESYLTEIAGARTFCFFDELDALRRHGLIKGGNLSSAVVIGRKSIINEKLRFEDEPVRHKILDLIGDLALIGRPVQGHIMAWKSGHKSNAAFAHYLTEVLGL